VTFLDDLGNNLKFIAMKSIEKKIDGREIGKNIEKGLDGNLGERVSEKTQRQPITSLLFEIIEGLWFESPSDLIQRVEVWVKTMKEKM